jgi:hypothetical protein
VSERERKRTHVGVGSGLELVVNGSVVQDLKTGEDLGAGEAKHQDRTERCVNKQR